MKGKVIKTLVVLGCLTTFCWTGHSTGISAADTKADKIDKGIYIGSLNVSGMTEQKAKKMLSKHIKQAKSQEITVEIDEHKATTTLDALGYSCDVDGFVDRAVNYAKTGNIIKRYKEREDLKQHDVKFALAFDLDSEAVMNFVKNDCSQYDVQAKNASWTRKNGTFEIEKESGGRVIVADETAEKIEKTISDKWVDGGVTLKAIMLDTKPQYDSSNLSTEPDVLGSYFTSFASSDNARSQNLVNAARLLNGFTLYPGEQFSVAEHLVPFSEEHGYKVSKAYANGQVVDSVGGGVCQAATTLYNALLKAELQIDERYNHSMIVSYVKASMDAAISEGNKDLKFTNNTEKPIYIEAYTANRSIYFSIYGEETRDLVNRRVEYESEVIETIEPGEDKEIVDPSLPEGYREVTQSAHTGYVAKLWKIVYENGEQVSKNQVNYSYYAAEPRYVTVGGKKPASTETPKTSEEPKEQKKDEQKKTEDEQKKTEQKQETSANEKKDPEPTEKPKATKAPVATPEPETVG